MSSLELAVRASAPPVASGCGYRREVGDGFFMAREGDRRGISGSRPDVNRARALAGRHEHGVGRERHGVDETTRRVDGIQGGDLCRSGWRRGADGDRSEREGEPGGARRSQHDQRSCRKTVALPSQRSASTPGVVAAVRVDRVILALAERHPLLGTVVEFHAHFGVSALRTVVGLQIDLLQILHA